MGRWAFVLMLAIACHRSGSDTSELANTSEGRLHVLMIDTSSSMYANDQILIQGVFRALAAKSVHEPLLGDHSGVVLLRFNGAEPPRSLDLGEDIIVIEHSEVYKTLLRNGLESQTDGLSPIYRAVEYAAGPLLQQPNVAGFIATHHITSPVILLITDSFNQDNPDDVCATNVPRLQHTLDIIDAMDATRRPVIHTFGIGTPHAPDAPILTEPLDLTANALCGDDANEPIVPDAGFDNVSLQLIARHGQGQSFATDNPKALREALIQIIEPAVP